MIEYIKFWLARGLVEAIPIISVILVMAAVIGAVSIKDWLRTRRTK